MGDARAPKHRPTIQRAAAAQTAAKAPARTSAAPAPRPKQDLVSPMLPVQRLASPNRPPAVVRDRDDAYEREAEAAAETVMAGGRVASITPLAGSRAPAPVQRQEEGEDPESENIQTLAAGPGTPGRDVAAGDAIRNVGAGRPLPPKIRRRLEEAFVADLRDVRVHDTAADRDAARALDARAFTHGHDIWLGPGESATDVRLMAHETTHVLQQESGIEAIQPAKGKKADEEEDSEGEDEEDEDAEETQEDEPHVVKGKSGKPPQLKVGTLLVPPFKMAEDTDSKRDRGALYKTPKTPPLFRAAGYDRGNPDQARKWDTIVKSDPIVSALKAAPFSMEEDHVYLLRSSKESTEDKNPRRYDRIGDAETIGEGLNRPYWNRQGEFDRLHVDHTVELQVSGWPRQTWANDEENYELLAGDANMESGHLIRDNVIAAITAFLNDPKLNAELPKKDRKKDAEDIKKKYDVIFSDVAAGTGPSSADSWDIEEVRKAAHLEPLKNPSTSEMRLYDLERESGGGVYAPHGFDFDLEDVIGSASKFVVYRSRSGGTSHVYDWNTKDTERPWQTGDPSISGFHVKTIGFNHNNTAGVAADVLGYVVGYAFKWQKEQGLIKQKKSDNNTWLIKRIPGTKYAGYLDAQQLRDDIGDLDLTSFSPVLLDDMYVSDEMHLVAGGYVLPTVPVFKDLKLQIVLDGDDLRLERAFHGEDFKLPGPVKVTGSTLVVSLGIQSGLGVRGRVDFAIHKVGKGYLGAQANTGTGFALEGGFNFDSKLFDPAQVTVWYRDNAFGGQGRLGIKKGKVKGIKSADVTINVAEDRIDAKGTVKTTIPGIEQGDLEISFSETDGLLIAAGLKLREDIPGIKNGRLQATVRKRPDADEYEVTARGSAESKIPGVTGGLDIRYDDGLITIEGNAAYDKGMLKGSLLLGATNRPLGEDGLPGAGEPESTLRAYGGGTVTVRIAPWLQGTVGMKLLPNGELELVGRIGLPDSLEIFPQKLLKKNLLTIGLDIPILGVAVAGQRVGIFATIQGGIDVEAGIGPGELRDLGIGIKYNPSREQDTEITGGARLHIPAHAGVRLFVRGGVGVGIPIVSATVGLEVGGMLGIAGALDAGVMVNWTPAKGLVLDAFAELYAEPKFRFDITAFVLVEADIIVDTITLVSEKWELAAVEYGAGLRLGVKFPVHYEEGKPFDVSLSDVEFQVPQINTDELLSGLIKQLTGGGDATRENAV
jgi:hypothetical protein